MVEVNSETDFAAGDTNSTALPTKLMAKLAQTKQADVEKLMAGELEEARMALVQKIGENITVRRPAVIEAPCCGCLCASNSKIACVGCL